MGIDAGHPFGTLRRGSLLIAVSVAVLALLAASGPAVASSSSSSASTTRTAGAIVAEARAAMLRAGSVSAHGGGTTSIPGVGQATVTETDYSEVTSGDQTVSMTSATPGNTALPQANTVDVSGVVYVEANAPFWTSTVGMPAGSATQIAGQWVLVPKNSPAYGPAAADLTMPSLVQDMFDAKSYRKGAVRTVDGVRAIAITYQNSGNDSGPATCYVSVNRSHLPVLLTIGGLTLHLGSWGHAQPVSAPAATVPLPSLGTSMASALPTVA